MRARLFDKGAVFAGWVGLGMALVIAIAFSLIIAVQTLVFIAAPLSGLVIGAYANVRSERWRPRLRVLANALYAGLVTGVGLALLYVAIRLVFIYGDSGYPNFNRTDPQTGQPIPPYCQAGPDCTYERQLAEETRLNKSGELASLGITDGATLESAALHELTVHSAGLVLLTLGGAALGGVMRGFSRLPSSLPLPAASRSASARRANSDSEA